ncbi:putative dehydratase/racemase [Mycobacterium kansasii]|uniref:Putative dehydratase/racemase n=1 Tax=Mycobacterium kansasii TaxID=1768 RepID=A0A1V3XLM3_MYCKA|nr:putative dehydratase/racemase [Mycobacterium kansasii]
MQGPALPLSGISIVEVSSFVAAPLCGMTLSQLGAQVIRVDPIGGAADVQRWPLAATGTSIYWTGLNKGKRSVTVDLRSAEGQQLVQRLVVEGDGIVVTNAGFPWLSHELLAARRSDVIHLQLLGRATGQPLSTTPSTRPPASRWSPVRSAMPARSTMCCRPGTSVAVCMPRSPSSLRCAAVTKRGWGLGSVWHWKTLRWRRRETWGC